MVAAPSTLYFGEWPLSLWWTSGSSECAFRTMMRTSSVVVGPWGAPSSPSKGLELRSLPISSMVLFFSLLSAVGSRAPVSLLVVWLLWPTCLLSTHFLAERIQRVDRIFPWGSVLSWEEVSVTSTVATRGLLYTDGSQIWDVSTAVDATELRLTIRVGGHINALPVGRYIYLSHPVPKGLEGARH